MALDEKHPPNTPMVTITDRNSNCKDLLSIFPPVNHEGLHNSRSPDSPFSSQSPDSPFSSTSPFSSSASLSSSISLNSDDSFPPSDCINQSPNQLDSRLQISAASGWLRFGLEILRRKIFNCSFPGYGTFVAAFRSFPLFSTLTVLYAGSLLLKWLSLRRNRQYKISILLEAIKQKDEKIVNLLDQIAQLNQLLLTRQTSH